ncbi:unnamed protein product [Cochlearia groenlandica]
MLETGVSSDYYKVIDDPQEQDLTVKQREIKGVEASHAVKASAFVSDIRRMNVALTRAKRALWVLRPNFVEQVTGNASALMKCEDWAALMTDARARNCFMEMEFIPKDFPVPKVPSFVPKATMGSSFCCHDDLEQQPVTETFISSCSSPSKSGQSRGNFIY